VIRNVFRDLALPINKEKFPRVQIVESLKDKITGGAGISASGSIRKD